MESQKTNAMKKERNTAETVTRDATKNMKDIKDAKKIVFDHVRNPEIEENKKNSNKPFENSDKSGISKKIEGESNRNAKNSTKLENSTPVTDKQKAMNKAKQPFSTSPIDKTNNETVGGTKASAESTKNIRNIAQIPHDKSKNNTSKLHYRDYNGKSRDSSASQKSIHSSKGDQSGDSSELAVHHKEAHREFENRNIETVEESTLTGRIETMNINKGDKYHASLSTCSNTSWGDLKVSKKVRDILVGQGFHVPSPVQAKSIPGAIEGRDLLIRAKNGTGKTISFVVPILNRINIEKNELQAIILVPIRELALQISRIIFSLGKSLGIKSMPIVGGSALTDDIIRLSSGTHILIGTPGRVVDLLSKKLCEISDSPVIVFDEADKLLDSVFFEAIYEFLSLIPQKRQMLLYSATFPESIEGFVNKYMKTPLKIKVTEGQELDNVKQYFVKINNLTKLPCLKSILQTLQIDQCIIYCSSISNVKLLAEKITLLGMSCYFIHSKMGQEERNIVYHNFSRNKCKILVSTDITTRGLDVPQVNVVINFDLPYSSESYLHRIGRSGRFGTDACAITMVSEDEKKILSVYADSFGMPLLPISDPSFKTYCK